MEIPFAKHSPGFKMCTDGDTCYCVAITSELAELVREDEDAVMEMFINAASEFLGEPSHFVDGINAGDFFHGEVSIMYFGRGGEEDCTTTK